MGLIVAGAMAPRAETRTDSALRDLKVFSETLALVDRQYVEGVDFRQLERGAYQGLAESLGPWSSFHDPVQLKSLLVRDRSADVGLLLLKHPQQYVRIAVVLPGSPAERAGIERGEFIETLDGLETKDLTLEEAQLMLAGPSGTSVRLGFFREADDEAGRSIELARQDLSALRVVSERRGTDAAALRVTDTAPGIARLVAAELARLEKLGVRSLVLDLRSNVGGTPQEAAALASVFTGPGVMFQRATRTGASAVEGGEAKAWPFKLIVLISRATLGEGELVAEALRVRLGVALIGQPTFGKTTQQDLVLLSDGTGLIMSVAEYKRADGSALPVKGIDPDEKVASRRAEPALVEPHAATDAEDDAEDGAAPEPSADASGKGSPGDAPAPTAPVNKFPTPEGVSPPVLPGQPSGRAPGQREAGAATPAEDVSDPQLDRAFEILAGAPLKKAA